MSNFRTQDVACQLLTEKNLNDITKKCRQQTANFFCGALIS